MIKDFLFLSVYFQPVTLRVEPDDGENQRRIGRSLSGTVVTSRRSRLTATRSFVSRIISALLSPCGLNLKCICLMSLGHVSCIACPCALLPPAVCLISSYSPVSNLSPCSLLLSLSLSKVKQADVSASPCLLPLF